MIKCIVYEMIILQYFFQNLIIDKLRMEDLNRLADQNEERDRIRRARYQRQRDFKLKSQVWSRDEQIKLIKMRASQVIERPYQSHDFDRPRRRRRKDQKKQDDKIGISSKNYIQIKSHLSHLKKKALRSNKNTDQVQDLKKKLEEEEDEFPEMKMQRKIIEHYQHNLCPHPQMQWAALQCGKSLNKELEEIVGEEKGLKLVEINK